MIHVLHVHCYESQRIQIQDLREDYDGLHARLRHAAEFNFAVFVQNTEIFVFLAELSHERLLQAVVSQRPELADYFKVDGYVCDGKVRCSVMFPDDDIARLQDLVRRICAERRLF